VIVDSRIALEPDGDLLAAGLAKDVGGYRTLPGIEVADESDVRAGYARLHDVAQRALVVERTDPKGVRISLGLDHVAVVLDLEVQMNSGGEPGAAGQGRT
jgi:hypothetical protein